MLLVYDINICKYVQSQENVHFFKVRHFNLYNNLFFFHPLPLSFQLHQINVCVYVNGKSILNM